jgi:hypothetical protein
MEKLARMIIVTGNIVAELNRVPPAGKAAKTPVQTESFWGLAEVRWLKTIGPHLTQVLETRADLFCGDEKAQA